MEIKIVKLENYSLHRVIVLNKNIKKYDFLLMKINDYTYAITPYVSKVKYLTKIDISDVYSIHDISDAESYITKNKIKNVLPETILIIVKTIKKLNKK